MLEPGLHYEWLVRSLCDVVAPRPVVLALQTQQLFATLLQGVELLEDRRIRELQLSRVNPVGAWQISAAFSFEAADGTPRPFRPELHPTRVAKGTTDGTRQHRRREQG